MTSSSKLNDGTRIAFVAIFFGLLAIVVSPLSAQEINDPPAKPSFARLAEPKIADALKLTDEQRRKVADLVTARAEALGKAAPADRPQVLVQSEKDMAAILSDEQRAAFAKEVAEPRLRFNFRFTKWADVLDWFAKQADLSLILDAPPPGTFNYSDSKEYSVTDALDELNRILSTKGFTLIRSGRMLIVIDLEDGIPEGLVPRISLDELAKRGKFELVSVMFPLGGRDPQAVKAEVTPLLGTYGKSVLLPTTKQLLVTDTAGIVRAVNAVIMSIPEPSTAPAPPSPPPVLGVYALQGADPKIAEDVLTKMFPGAKIAADVKAEQINAFAPPSDQAAIKSVIDQMLAQNPPDKKPRLDVYPVRNQDTNQLMTNLALVAPTGRLTYDPRERQVIAFANPTEQANIKAALEKLGSTGSVEKTKQLEVYRFSKADPSTTLTLLQGLLPQSKLNIDPQTKRLVAIATPEDHAAIQAILDHLQSAEPGPDTQTIKFYPLEHNLPAGSLAVLSTLAPKAQITTNTDAKQLQVLASLSDHALIKASLDELLKGVPAPERRQFTVYRVKPEQRARFQTVLPSVMTDYPDIRVIPESEPTELAIWAKPAQHEALKAVIDSLAADIPDAAKPSLVSHPYRFADPSTVMSILKTLVPDAKISLDAGTRSLVAIASPDNHATIKATIDKLQPGDLGHDALILKYYPIEKPLSASTLSAFARLVPKATLTPEADGKWLQVVATRADQEAIKRNMDELIKEMPAAEKRKLVVYAVTPSQRTRFQAVSSSLATDLPDIRVVTDGNANELAIWAKPSQHEVLKDMLDELKRESPTAEKNQFRAYPLKFADPTTAMTVLQTLFPGAKINVDTTTNRLLIWTRADDHAAIKQAIEEIDSDKLSERQDKVMVYPAPDIDLDVAVGLIQQMLPKIRVMKDVKARTVVAWGKKTDHEVIARALASMQATADGDQKPRLKIYQAGKINAANVIDVLRTTFPNARLAVDTKTGGLAALASGSEQKEIEAAINEMKAQAIGESGHFAAYRLFKTERETVIPIITQAAPESRVTSSKDPTQLMVWARPADHVIIERIINDLESASVPNKNFELKIYTVKSVAASNVFTVLGRAVPKAMINPSADPHRLIVYALPADHALIQQILEQFDAEHAADTKSEFYDLQRIDGDSALRLVQGILQKQGTGSTAMLIPGTHQLYVEARPEQHALITKALQGLRPVNDTGFEVFNLDTVDAFAASSMISRMFSNTKTQPPLDEADGTAQKLYIRGTQEQLVRVRELLEKMGESSLSVPGGHAGVNRRVRVIPFGGDAGAAISEIQRIWPQLRSNELRVIPGPESKFHLNAPRKSTEPNTEVPPPPKPSLQNSPKADPIPKPDPDEDEDFDDEEEDDGYGQLPTNSLDPDRFNERIAKLPARSSESPIVARIALQSDEAGAIGAEKKAASPIIIMPRDGTVTILSDDPEALDQLDKLIRALSGPSETGGRAFAVFSLKYAGATSVAETIRQALRLQSGGGGSRMGSAPTVVADERLNAIVVHANRADRAAIEKLIDTLDSSEIPETLAANRPKRVPVKFASALQIEQVLRLVYKQQLTTGGGRKEIPIPAGLAPEFSAMLQQMNASNTGPILSLSVDQMTNSIVILAPTFLTEQVSKLIEDLDQASVTEDAQMTSIIPTRRMNSTRTQKLLNLILDKNRRRDAKRPTN